MMEVLRTPETSVNFYVTTQRNIPEDSHLRIRRRENPKSHLAHCLVDITANYLNTNFS
jgi:hypothetical protein